MSSEEARVLAEGNPLSFLRVSKPEIELPSGTDPYAHEVYARGRRNFDRLQREGALLQDDRPGLYLYRQDMGGHSQTGLVALASCSEYLDGTIRRHELTRPDKEDDRVRHVEALDAQTGPAFLTYRAVAGLDASVAVETARPPAIDFTSEDRVRHRAWPLFDPGLIGQWVKAFDQVPRLYIADGHHRTAAAARVCEKRGGRGGSDRFLAVIFPHNQMQVLPYNRVLRDLRGRTREEILRALEAVVSVRPSDREVPAGRHELAFYLEHQWFSLQFRPALTQAGAALDQLDVSLLQRHILEPLFGIKDPRTSPRISFVGGIRGPAELERMVDSGAYSCAFSMYPTGIDELMAIADAGGLLPPKSTWFEPKLRDGMFSHRLTEG